MHDNIGIEFFSTFCGWSVGILQLLKVTPHVRLKCTGSQRNPNPRLQIALNLYNGLVTCLSRTQMQKTWAKMAQYLLRNKKNCGTHVAQRILMTRLRMHQAKTKISSGKTWPVLMHDVDSCFYTHGSRFLLLLYQPKNVNFPFRESQTECAPQSWDYIARK